MTDQMNQLSNRTISWKQQDAENHLHPFTSHPVLRDRGVRMITGAKGVYLEDSEGNHSVPELYLKNDVQIKPEYFEAVVEGLERVVNAGTARLAYIPGIPVCGKTGTSQNPQGKDHSVFFAFAPKDNPKIAIATFVENAGWGGRAAGSTASLLIEKHIRGSIKRTWVEDYVLKGDFTDAKRSDESN